MYALSFEFFFSYEDMKKNLWDDMGPYCLILHFHWIITHEMRKVYGFLLNMKKSRDAGK